MLSLKWIFLLIPLLLVIFTVNAYGEVTKFHIETESSESIRFIGETERGDSGLVKIIVYDANYEFVSLFHALIKPDKTFKQTVQINELIVHNGFYQATAFITNLKDGKTRHFEYKDPIENDNPLIPSSEITEYDSSIQLQNKQIHGIAAFVDPKKDPEYYLQRYYTEPEYKDWFDRNYPDRTIEDAVGYTEKLKQDQEFKAFAIPNAEATTEMGKSENPNNNEIAQMILALSGIGILFAAVYGIKRKVDHNFHLISINRESIKKKIIKPLTTQKPIETIQFRLAKGEITPKEFDDIKKRLEID